MEEIWSGFGRLMTSLLCCLPFVKHHVHTVGMALHQEVQRRLSLVLRSLDVSGRRRQRWRDVVQKGARLRGMQCDAGVLGNTDSEFIPSNERHPQAYALGRIVFLPSVNARHIRDGPHRCRQRRDALLADDLRKVA